MWHGLPAQGLIDELDLMVGPRATRHDSRTDSRRAAEALHALEQGGEPVNFPAVARRAGVCRCSTPAPRWPLGSPLAATGNARLGSSGPGNFFR
jgi:hypothetical protein